MTTWQTGWAEPRSTSSHCGSEKAMGFFHEFSGWLMFLVSLGLLYFVHLAMKKWSAFRQFAL